MNKFKKWIIFKLDKKEDCIYLQKVSKTINKIDKIVNKSKHTINLSSSWRVLWLEYVNLKSQLIKRNECCYRSSLEIDFRKFAREVWLKYLKNKFEEINNV